VRCVRKKKKKKVGLGKKNADLLGEKGGRIACRGRKGKTKKRTLQVVSLPFLPGDNYLYLVCPIEVVVILFDFRISAQAAG